MNPIEDFAPIQTAEQLFRHRRTHAAGAVRARRRRARSRCSARSWRTSVDYADLYFQYSRAEGWSLEEGIVKSGSFNIDQGVGVRAVSGEKTAFAYSDDISLPALEAAAHATRAIAAPGQRPAAAPMAHRTATAAQLYLPHDPIASLDDADKVALLERLERMRARARPARDAGHGAASPANTKWCWWRAPTACWPPTCARWCACRCR